MKNLIVLALCFVMIGCFAEWQEDTVSIFRVLDGPISDPGKIESGVYQNGISIYNSYIDIEIMGGPTMNGVTTFYTDENGEYWLLLDVSMLSIGDVFTIEINDEIKEYEVI